jgi:flotillin
MMILSGRPTRMPDGSSVGYRVVGAGRVLRLPIIERADLLDVRARTIEGGVQNAYSKDTLPLVVGFSALVRIDSSPRHIHNAVERFLGRALKEVDRVAEETLEGHLRSVIAELTLEELRSDKDKIADLIRDSSDSDFEKLGLAVEALQIKSVATT